MNRFFYRNPAGLKFEFESEEDRNKWGAPDLVRMTQEEVDAHLAEPPPTPEQIIEAMRADIQGHMDAAAKAYGYDDIKAAVTYAEEPVVPKFQAEGRAFRAWRSLVWAYAYGVLDEVKAGDREQPTADELLAELPELVVE